MVKNRWIFCIYALACAIELSVWCNGQTTFIDTVINYYVYESPNGTVLFRAIGPHEPYFENLSHKLLKVYDVLQNKTK